MARASFPTCALRAVQVPHRGVLVEGATNAWLPAIARVQRLFAKFGVALPTTQDWEDLKASVMAHGIYNRNLQAIPPTGSISYINSSTASIHPIASKIEIRKEGKLGRVYYPAPYLTDDNQEFY